MMKDYLSRRQNVVQAPAAQLNAKLAALEEAFGEAWLTEDGLHPLQSLWKRQDALATNELLNFGDAVERLHQEAPGWLEGQVRAIKSGDVGQSMGAIFEVIALNLFSRKSCQVIPAPDSTPGFDGTLVLGDNSRILVSIKNHGWSSREQEFRAEANAFDEKFKEQLEVNKLRNLEVNILAEEYLDAAAFRTLKSDLAGFVADMKAGRFGRELDRPYTIVLRNMETQYGSLSAFGMSSSCRIMSPTSPNEQANFEDAIRKGCANLYKHTKSEDGDVCRMIILRLSNTASIAKCRDWAGWYFKEYPDDPIDLILLYQSAVTTDVASNSSSITHYISWIPRRRFSIWRQKKDGGIRRLPDISILVGVIANEQPSQQLICDDFYGIDLSNYYVYQRADVYQKVESHTVTHSNLSNPASGIIVHAILEKDGVPIMTVSPKAEREKALALLP